MDVAADARNENRCLTNAARIQDWTTDAGDTLIVSFPISRQTSACAIR